MNQSSKQVIKNHTPLPVWIVLRALRHGPRNLGRWLRQKSQIRQWKWMLMSTTGPRGPASVDCAALQNSLPNSGGIPADPTRIDPVLVARANSVDDRYRAAGFDGFEGLALDDALGW